MANPMFDRLMDYLTGEKGIRHPSSGIADNRSTLSPGGEFVPPKEQYDPGTTVFSGTYKDGKPAEIRIGDLKIIKGRQIVEVGIYFSGKELQGYPPVDSVVLELSDKVGVEREVKRMKEYFKEGK